MHDRQLPDEQLAQESEVDDEPSPELLAENMETRRVKLAGPQFGQVASFARLNVVSWNGETPNRFSAWRGALKG